MQPGRLSRKMAIFVLMRSFYSSIVLGGLVLGCIGCGQKEVQENCTRFKESSSLSSFLPDVSSVRLIPIYDDHLLGSRVEMISAKGSFILSDMSNDVIYRYDDKGFFLNEIGRKGNGPGEYSHVSNVQLIDQSKVAVVSPFKGIYYYDLAGEFLCKEDVDNLGLQTVINAGSILTYYGYLSTEKYRLCAMDSSSEPHYYLPNKFSVIPYSTTIPQLSVYDGKVFIIDSYNNVLYSYDSGELNEYEVFDFGKYRVPDDYFNATDPYQGAELLLGSEFAFIQRYLMSDYCSIIEVAIQKHSGLTFTYGLKKGDQWIWFGEDGKQDGKVFTETPRALVGNKLYTLIDPDRFDESKALYYNYLSNKEEVESIEKGRLNYVIGEITLN